MDDGYSVHIVDDVGAGANPADSPVPPDDTAVIDGGAAIRDEALDVFPHSVTSQGWTMLMSDPPVSVRNCSSV